MQLEVVAVEGDGNVGPLGVFMRTLHGYMVHSPLVLNALLLCSHGLRWTPEMAKMTPNVDVGLLLVVWVEGSVLTCCCCCKD